MAFAMSNPAGESSLQLPGDDMDVSSQHGRADSDIDLDETDYQEFDDEMNDDVVEYTDAEMQEEDLKQNDDGHDSDMVDRAETPSRFDSPIPNLSIKGNEVMPDYDGPAFNKDLQVDYDAQSDHISMPGDHVDTGADGDAGNGLTTSANDDKALEGTNMDNTDPSAFDQNEQVESDRQQLPEPSDDVAIGLNNTTTGEESEQSHPIEPVPAPDAQSNDALTGESITAAPSEKSHEANGLDEIGAANANEDVDRQDGGKDGDLQELTTLVQQQVDGGEAGLEDGVENNEDETEEKEKEAAEAEEDASYEDPHLIIVCFGNIEVRMFCPSDPETAESYFLDDVSLLYSSFNELFQACREALRVETTDCQLSIDFPELGTAISENSPHASAQTLATFLELFVGLCEADGLDSIPPFYVSLHVRQEVDTRLQMLHQALNDGRGLSQLRLIPNTEETSENDDGQGDETAGGEDLGLHYDKPSEAKDVAQDEAAGDTNARGEVEKDENHASQLGEAAIQENHPPAETTYSNDPTTNEQNDVAVDALTGADDYYINDDDDHLAGEELGDDDNETNVTLAAEENNDADVEEAEVEGDEGITGPFPEFDEHDQRAESFEPEEAGDEHTHDDAGLDPTGTASAPTAELQDELPAAVDAHELATLDAHGVPSPEDDEDIISLPSDDEEEAALSPNNKRQRPDEDDNDNDAAPAEPKRARAL